MTEPAAADLTATPVPRLAGLLLRQDIGTAIAGADSFAEALHRFLDHAGRWLGASYCIVPEADPDRRSYRYIAGYAVDEAVIRNIAPERNRTPRPLTELSCAATLTDGIAIDSGPLDEAGDAGPHRCLAAAIRLGTRRQFALPLPVGTRRFALLVGFKTPAIPTETRALCHDLADWAIPLLQGKLREDALARSNALLDRTNRALQTLTGCNQALARAATEPDLVAAICRVAVEIGRYSAAWVGMAEPGPDAVLRPAAHAGTGLDDLETQSLSWADVPHGRGPAAIAVRENRTVIIDDIAHPPPKCPCQDIASGILCHGTGNRLPGHTPGKCSWRDAARRAGYTACIALPLRDAAGVAFGALALYALGATDPDDIRHTVFDSEEIRLLTELATDLAYGIRTLRDRAARTCSEQRLTRLLESSSTIIYAMDGPVDADGPADPAAFPFTEISANIERLFGYTPDAALAPAWWIDNVHPSDRSAVLAGTRQLLTRDTVIHRYRFRRHDGTWRWVRDELTAIRDSEGRIRRIVGAWVDITEKQQADEDIYRLAYFDQLTGLPNRAALQLRLQAELAGARGSGTTGALLFIDLDGFKAINDLRGHPVGDIVLDQVGRRLQSALRGSDTVARLGGDEFVVLLSRLAGTTDRAADIAHDLAQKLHTALVPPVHAAGHECYVTASIGIALFPQDASGIDDILRQADIAMYQAKASDIANTAFFEPAMQDRVAQRHAIEQTLREALDHDRFEVWLQPQVGRGSDVIGVEALIRLRRADGSIVLPNDFIPVAEQTGVVLAMGKWMLRAVCRIIADQARRGRRLRIAINVSPRQFRDPAFVPDVERVLAETGVDPHDLLIEITESLLIDRLDEVAAKMRALATHGIRFSIDDFGTGYSSLGYLQTLPIAEIKIDRGFIRHLPDGARDATLAEAILAMTRHLGLSVVAEGVETEAQAAFLRLRDCDSMQGYLFGRPEPAGIWLDRWSAALTAPIPKTPTPHGTAHSPETTCHRRH
ncbi:MAG TPA: EAL domain-containing protein [Acidiphilium sp.]